MNTPRGVAGFRPDPNCPGAFVRTTPAIEPIKAKLNQNDGDVKSLKKEIKDLKAQVAELFKLVDELKNKG